MFQDWDLDTDCATCDHKVNSGMNLGKKETKSHEPLAPALASAQHSFRRWSWFLFGASIVISILAMLAYYFCLNFLYSKPFYFLSPFQDYASIPSSNILPTLIYIATFRLLLYRKLDNIIFNYAFRLGMIVLLLFMIYINFELSWLFLFGPRAAEGIQVYGLVLPLAIMMLLASMAGLLVGALVGIVSRTLRKTK